MKDLEKALKQDGFIAEKIEIDKKSELFVLSDADRAQYNRICGLLSQNAERTETNQIGKNPFCFIGSGENLIGVGFSPNNKEIRVTCETGNDYFSVFPEHGKGTANAVPLLTQCHLACMSADCGMSYVLRTTDGRFILIDGGEDDYEESERLFDLLCAQTETGGKPIVAACFITHLHDDHTTAFCRLWKDHKDDFVLESLIYNIVPDKFNVVYPHAVFDTLLPKIKAHGTALIPARTGMKFSFAGLDIDMLYTPDDGYPNAFSNFNDSSLIFRADFSGRRILFLGDAMPRASDSTANRYEKDDLACEFLQVGHHGYGGGSDKLNRMCDPETLLWPCPAFWYPSVRLWSSNDFLRSSSHIKHILLSGFGTVTLDMTKPVPEEAEKHFSAGETVYEEDFQSVKRLVDLNYECVTGGETGLVSAKYAFEKDSFGRHLTLKTDGNSLVGLAAQNILSVPDAYEAKILLRVSENAKIGIMAAHAMPNLWKDGNTHWLSSDTTQEMCELTVRTDYPAHTLELTWCGKTEKYPTDGERGGLYLALEKAEAALYHVKITAE